MTLPTHPNFEAVIPALTLKQPWAWAVIHGGKDVENRDKITRIRGLFAVHAGQANDPAYYREAVLWMTSRGLARSDVHPEYNGPFSALLPTVPPLEELPRGVIIGTAALVDVLAKETELGWKMPGKFGYVLANRKSVPHRRCSGMPGWFKVPVAGLT